MTALASHLESWLLAYLLNAAWQTPFVFVAAWLAARLARRSGPLAEYRIWTSALVLEATLPACSITARQLIAEFIDPLRQLAAQLFGVHASAGAVHVAIITGPVYARTSLRLPPSLLAGIAFVYAAAVLYFAARLVWRLYRTRALRRSAQAVALTGTQQESWDRLSRIFAIDDASLAISPDIPGPATIGLRHRMVLFPEGMLSVLSDGDLAIALAHEFAHMRRRDVAKNLACELLSLPIAWHPLLWLTHARLTESREMVCDAIAAEVTAGPRSYAHSLLRLASMLSHHTSAKSLHAIGIFDANIFERRIMNLTEPQRKLKGAARLVTLAACVTLGLATCASALTLHMGVSAPAAQDENRPASGQAIRVSGGVMAGQILSKVPPIYPPEARQAGIQGAVVLHAVIGKDGTIRSLKLVSGPDELLEKAAWTAVSQWIYKPFLLNGNPVDVETTITVNFSLGNSAGQQPPTPPPTPQADAEETHPLGGGDGVAYNGGGSVRPPVLAYAPPAEYPADARKAKLAGNVLVSLIVDSAGEPQNVRVVRGLGNELDEKAVEAVQRYRFHPATQNGEPVPANLKVQVNFQIF